MNIKTSLPIKIYRLVAGGGQSYLMKFKVFLDDRPGSLASFSSLIARCGGNIAVFHYDRSQDKGRVVIEAQMADEAQVQALLSALEAGKYVFTRPDYGVEQVELTSPENILEIKARLEDRPGTLASFAGLLKEHAANVLYMLYDEETDPESADIAIAAKGPSEVDVLLEAINAGGYQYRVMYRGSQEENVERIIGLKAVEKFFLRLSSLLSGEDVGDIKGLVDSSQELYGDLVKFYSEAGKNLDSADVFEKVLALATMSRSRTGPRFSVSEMPLVQAGEGVELFSFRMPTSENVFIFRQGDELVMVDSGYGVYYDDLKDLMHKRGLEPEKVRRIYVTHADADHAGTSGYFQDEFGTAVFMHPESAGVIQNDNRAHGVTGRRVSLNRFYTRLVNKFTGCRFPKDITFFKTERESTLGPVFVIDTFAIGALSFQVIESRGGHIPGHVFFACREAGLFFASDYLININSLNEEEKRTLGVYKYLLMNPNSDSGVFREETAAVREAIGILDEEMKRRGKRAVVFPGHGEYFLP